MACIITITSVTGVGSPLPSSVHVVGTATPGGCGTVKVTLQCSGPATTSLLVPVDAAGNWIADFTSLADLQCSCGKQYVVFAECSDTTGCKSAEAKGPLPCPQPGCPTAAVTVTPLGCTPEGKRTVQLAATITGAGTIATQWDFGDGFLGPASPLLTYSVTHEYITPGPYTAQLNVILPTGCPPAAVVTVGPLDRCDTMCPTVSLAVSVVGCAGGGGATATATFTATLTPPLAGCTYHWNFGDGNTLTTLVPTATHNYTTSGTFAASVAVVCGPICVTPMGITVTVNPCCPLLDTVTPSLSGCVRASPASVATVTWVATTIPPGSSGTFFWQYDDGMTATTTAPSHTRTYATTGTKSVTVTYTPSVPGCPQTIVTNSVVVPACDDGGGGDGGGGEGLGCFGLRVIMTIAAILAIVSLSLAACIPAAATALLWLALGLGITAAVAGLLWGFLCPKPCAWALLLAWQVSLGVGFILLYFTLCCPAFWVIGLGLVALGIGLMLAWKRRCHKSKCAVLKELVVALSGVVLPLLGWLGVIPVLAACINHLVAGVLSTLAAAVALAAASCVP